MANIYDIRRYGRVAFLLLSVGVVALFLYFSNNLVTDLAQQERQRMEIWADATKALVGGQAMISDDEDPVSLFLLSITERNTNIPVLLVDEDDQILQHRNFDLPEQTDSTAALAQLSAANEQFLQQRLADLKGSHNKIEIQIAPNLSYYLYYEDSKLLKRLSYYPYVQLLVMLAFVAVVYFAVLSTKKAEQNKVWVGLSKETAHQLGTPISSLMAWMELLESLGIDPDTVREMDKDVNRLNTIASRFSKIGSKPQMLPESLNTIVENASEYMRSRISSRIQFHINLSPANPSVMASTPLFEWVMENLIKNAVDAMEGNGSITVTTAVNAKGDPYVEVSDTGRGIPRKRQKTIFNPGYTTKERGWGLGLTLAKRIIEQYHGGHIYVASSEPGRGTTFRIDLPPAPHIA